MCLGNVPDSNKDGTSLAITAGVFLLVYDLPWLFFTFRMIGSWAYEDLNDAVMCLFALLLAAAAVFLFLGKAKTAAVLLSAAAVMCLITYLPLAADLLDGAIELEGTVPDGSASVTVSRWLALYPIGEILAWMLLSVALFLRGKGARILTWFSAVAEGLSCWFSFKFSGYRQGHLTPLSLFLPLLFIFATIFIGFWLRFLDSGSGGTPEST